jgi:predicted N-acetyltransferase YhbS
MRIEPLAEHAAFVPVVAAWHFGEWGHADPAGTVESWTAALAERTRRDGVPCTYVAVEGGVPVGSAALVDADMDTHPEMTPWLAGVYVVPEWRGRGVGTALVRRAAARAAELGLRHLYLYSTRPGFYARLGWRALGTEPHEGEVVTLMRLDLGA